MSLSSDGRKPVYQQLDGDSCTFNSVTFGHGDVFDPRTPFITSNNLRFVIYLQNIMKYLLSEAKEKEQTAFQKGWKINIIKVNFISSA